MQLRRGSSDLPQLAQIRIEAILEGYVEALVARRSAASSCGVILLVWQRLAKLLQERLDHPAFSRLTLIQRLVFDDSCGSINQLCFLPFYSLAVWTPSVASRSSSAFQNLLLFFKVSIFDMQRFLRFRRSSPWKSRTSTAPWFYRNSPPDLDPPAQAHI